MHPREIQRQQREDTQRLQECAKKLGELFGVEDAEEKAVPSYPGKIRRDPAMVQMHDVKALADVIEEVVTKAESMDVGGEAPVTSLEELKGVSDDTKLRLYFGGIYSVEDVREASEEDLTAVKGIGPAKARDLKQQAGVGAR